MTDDTSPVELLLGTAIATPSLVVRRVRDGGDDRPLRTAVQEDGVARTPQWLLEFVRHALRGLVGLSLHLVLLTILVEAAGMGPELASVVTVPVLMLLGFALTEGWVFANHDVARGLWPLAKRAVSFWTIQNTGGLVKFALYLGVLQVLPRTAPWYQLAWILAAVIVFIATFAANRWVWTTAADTTTHDNAN